MSLSAIMAIAGAAASLAGGATSAIAGRKSAQQTEQQRKENKAWYERKYNENALERSEAAHNLSRMRDAMKKRSELAAGRAAVSGETAAAQALEKQAQNDAMAQATAQIASTESARKDATEAQYRQTDAQLSAQQAQIEAQKSANIANAASQAIAAAATVAGSGDIADDYTKKPEDGGAIPISEEAKRTLSSIRPKNG